MTTKKVFTLDPQTIPWSELSEWQKEYIKHTLESIQKYNMTLPPNCFPMMVCKMILAKVS